MTILFGAPVFLDGDPPAGAGEAHGSTSQDFDAIAQRHVQKGYSAGYAPKPAVTDVQTVAAARRAFEAVGVRIAEVGCWTNLLADDPGLRAANLNEMTSAFELADALGAGCVIATVGSVRAEGPDHHDKRNFSREAFDRTVDNARRLIDSVRPERAKLVFEVLPFDFTDTPAGVRQLVEAIDRDQFGVHVDLVNWLMRSPRTFYGQAEVMESVVENLGPWIVAAHCKDARLQAGYEPRVVEVPPGEGDVDLRGLLLALDSLSQDVTLLLEHLEDEDAYDRASAHVREEALQAAVRLRLPRACN